MVANVDMIVSGLLWRSAPRLVLDAARADVIHLFTSASLLAELEDVLTGEQFAQRLAHVSLTPRDLVLGWAVLDPVIEPKAIGIVILSTATL